MAKGTFEALTLKEFEHISDRFEDKDTRLNNHAERIRGLEIRVAGMAVITGLVTLAVGAAITLVITGG